MIAQQKVNLSHAFACQNVGVTQVGDRIWLVTFMQYDLGYVDDGTCRLEPIESLMDYTIRSFGYFKKSNPHARGAPAVHRTLPRCT
jgi:hypothetical protein